MSEDIGVFMGSESLGRGHVAVALPVHTSCVLWPPSVIWSISISVLHCEVGQSQQEVHSEAFPSVIEPAQAFLLSWDRYYTSVINPAVCVAARLQFGLCWSTLCKRFKKNNPGSRAFVCLSAWTLPLRFPALQAKTAFCPTHFMVCLQFMSTANL